MHAEHGVGVQGSGLVDLEIDGSGEAWRRRNVVAQKKIGASMKLAEESCWRDLRSAGNINWLNGLGARTVT